MTIFEGSRYENAVIIRTKASDGQTRPTVYAGLPGGTTQYRTYIAEGGERFDTMAHSLWGDAELWWRIANLNPELLYPGTIPPGTVVRLPV